MLRGPKGDSSLGDTGVLERIDDGGGEPLRHAAVVRAGRTREAVERGVLASRDGATSFRDFTTATPKMESQ